MITEKALLDAIATTGVRMHRATHPVMLIDGVARNMHSAIISSIGDVIAEIEKNEWTDFAFLALDTATSVDSPRDSPRGEPRTITKLRFGGWK